MRLQSKVVVSIEFVADIEVLKEDLTALGSSTPEAALQETFFLMPIQFIIDGSDVFSQVNQATRFVANQEGETKVEDLRQLGSIRLPLLDFAVQGFQAVKALSEKHQTKYPAPGGWNLFFQREGKIVKVTSDVNGKQMSTDYDDLYRAFSKFESEVRIFLREHAPPLKLHPYWGPWLAQN